VQSKGKRNQEHTHKELQGSMDSQNWPTMLNNWKWQESSDGTRCDHTESDEEGEEKWKEMQ